MKIKKEMKINKFRIVAIPSKGEYMRKFGAINTPGNYSGETVSDQMTDTRKTGQMHALDEGNKKAAEAAKKEAEK